MSESEYVQSGCYNKHCKFTLIDGQIEYGVVETFFFEEREQYYLVRSPQMVEFKKCSDENDIKRMKELCVRINLEVISAVERFVTVKKNR